MAELAQGGYVTNWTNPYYIVWSKEPERIISLDIRGTDTIEDYATNNQENQEPRYYYVSKKGPRDLI